MNTQISATPEVRRGDRLYYISSRAKSKTRLVYIGFEKENISPMDLPIFSFKITPYVFNKPSPGDDEIATTILDIAAGNKSMLLTEESLKFTNESPLNISLERNEIHEVIFYLGVNNWYFAPPAFEFKDPNTNLRPKWEYEGYPRFWGLKWFSHHSLFGNKKNGGIRIHYDARQSTNSIPKDEYPFNLFVNINQVINGIRFNTPLKIDPIIRNDP